MAYSLITGFSGVKRDADSAFIPDAPANLDWQVYQEWLAAGNTPTPAPTPPTNTVISSYAYFLRFTPAETSAIQTASLAQPPTTNSLTIYNYMLQAAAAGSVDLTNPTVVGGHAFLVSLGLLTQARSTAILTP